MLGDLFAITNDWHLKQGCEEQVLKSVEFIIEEMNRRKLTDLVIAGDIFDSRSFQRQESLYTLDLIFEKFAKAGVNVLGFPGNHDKSVYSSNKSFLDAYKHHPNFTLYRDPKLVKIKGVSVFLVPFFSEDILVKILKAGPKADMLISHFDLNGSSYLSHVVSGKRISIKDLKKWKKRYFGHFHDLFEIDKDTVHLPSLFQSHFGENNIKGFSIIKEDLSYEVVRGPFREYIKKTINLDKTTSKEVKELIKEYTDSPDIIRFEFIGNESKLRALDKKQFSKVGIDAKVKFSESKDTPIEDAPKLTEVYTEDDIQEDFQVFCVEKELDLKVGKVYLDKFLKKEDN